MFGFFRKKGDDFNQKLESINSMLKGSFENIKNDIGLISQWINTFNDKHEQHDKKFIQLTSRIELLEEKLAEKEFLSSTKLERSSQRSIVHERVQSFNR